MGRRQQARRSSLIEWLEKRWLFNQPGANWQLNFDDEFNGTSLDTTKWANYLPWTSSATGDNRYEGGAYSDYMVNANTTISGVNLTSNVSESGGALHLSTQQTSTFTVGSQSFNYTGAMLTTSGKEGNYSSGYFEIRAKLPSGAKNWPAFWMTNGWPPEDDIMEYWPTHNSASQARLHQGLYGMDQNWHDYNDNPSSLNTSNYHTFGMEWGPGYQKFYLDGTLRLTDTTGVPTSANPEYILLNSAVDASKPGTYSGSAASNTLDVDYVRIYSYTATPGPAIANPGFDVSGSWTLSGKAGYNVGGGLGQTGTGDLHIYGGAGEADQAITGLSPNTSYTLQGYAEDGTLGSAVGTLGVRNFSNGAGDTSTAIGSTTQVVWLPGSVTFTTGPSDTSAVIYLKNTGTGNLNFDDLYFEKAPVVNPVANQFIPSNGTANIAISATNTSSQQGLGFSATSDNSMLLPAGSMVFTGSGTNRTLQLTPAVNVTGSANVTVTLTDEFGSVTTDTFVVSTAVVINGDRDSSNESDSIRLVRDGSVLDAFVNNTSTTPTQQYDFSSLGAVAVNSLGGDDVLTLDMSGGNIIPSGGLNVDLGTSSRGDSLIITGGTSDDAVVLGNASVVINGQTINYANEENLAFDFGTGNDQLSTSGIINTHLQLNVNGDTLTLAPDCALPGSADVTINSGVLNVGKTSQNIDAFASSAGASVQLDGGTLSVGNSSGGATFAGSITGTGEIIKNGAAVWTLSGSSSFAGALTINAGTVTISNPHALDSQTSLSINNTARVNLSSNLGSAVMLAGISIAPGATMDIANNDVAIDYTGATILPAVQSLLDSGYAIGAWTGTAIRSSTAAASGNPGPRMAPGAMESSSIFSAFPALFGNQTVDDSAVLIHYAIVGDTAVNGVVNALDFNSLATDFGSSGANWSGGDFNYDGVVDASDFTLLAQNFGASIPAAAVPRLAAPVSAQMLFSSQSIITSDDILDRPSSGDSPVIL